MFCSQVRFSIAMASWLMLAFTLLRALPAEDAPPRYKLQVGQELRYSGNSEFKYQNGEHNNDTTWRIWVVRQNADGGWRLIVRSGSMFRASMDPKSVKRDERVTFAWCDMSPEGEIAENDSLGFNVRLYPILPRLPHDRTAAAAGWTTENVRQDERINYRLVSNESTAEQPAIEIIPESAMNEIYGMSSKLTVLFDLKRGIPEKISTQNKQTYGINGEGHGTTKLDDGQTHGGDWSRAFAADADRYFAAKQVYESAASATDQSPEELEKALKRAVANLQAARDAIQSVELKEQLDQDIKQHDQFTKYYLDEAKKRLAILNHPAAEWTCSDLAGKEHSLKDYRSRVVVLDFWYRGCGWCIRAMPQMKEIAAHFGNQPVTVFGMNTDRNEEDAQFVIDKMGLNYQTLKATGVPEKYKVNGFPTLLIIDQEGVLRDIHVGYSPDLKEKVVESIDRLLKKKS